MEREFTCNLCKDHQCTLIELTNNHVPIPPNKCPRCYKKGENISWELVRESHNYRNLDNNTQHAKTTICPKCNGTGWIGGKPMVICPVNGVVGGEPCPKCTQPEIPFGDVCSGSRNSDNSGKQ